MTERYARHLLARAGIEIGEEGDLYCLTPSWVSWWPSTGDLGVSLDGDFDADTLAAIAWWMGYARIQYALDPNYTFRH